MAKWAALFLKATAREEASPPAEAMDDPGGALVINQVKNGMTADHSKSSSPASCTRSPAGETSNKPATRRDETVKEPLSAAMEVDLCQAFSQMLLRSNVEDVDANDGENPQLCSDYVKDIYCYLRKLEVQAVCRNELQLVGVTAMLLASKYEETYVPSIMDFVYITDRAYTSAQIRAMECKILKELDFVLGRPLPLHFLRRAIKVCEATAELYMLAKYLMELTLVDYDMVHFSPSETAAAALCLSQKVLLQGHWNPKLCYYTGYEEDSLALVMRHMAKNVVKVNKNLTKYTAVRTKYASSKFLRISTVPQLNCSPVKGLAAPLLGQSGLVT